MTRMMDIPRRIPLVGEMYRCIFVNTCSPSKKKHGCFFFGGGEVKDIYIYILYMHVPKPIILGYVSNGLKPTPR